MILSLNNTLLMQSRMCQICKKSYTMKYKEWCQPCNSNYLQNNFKKWTSKNIEIDKFLQEVQCNADGPNKVVEWIPYNRLKIDKKIGEGGFGIIHMAHWIDGLIYNWNIHNQIWNRYDHYLVALKILKNSDNLTNLLEEVSYYKF